MVKLSKRFRGKQYSDLEWVPSLNISVPRNLLVGPFRGRGHLEDEGAAGGQRGGHLPAGHGHGVVPGGDLPAHPHRLLPQVQSARYRILIRSPGAAGGHLPGEGHEAAVYGQRVAVDLVRPAREVSPDCEGVVQVAPAVRHRLARVQALK